MPKYVAAIDQGTTSSRLILFDKDGQIQCVDQKEHEQITPKAGWVEHDAKEIWRKTREVIGGAMAKSDAEAGDVAAIGITNQRETTVVWDRETGEPVYNAIVWQDTRTEEIVQELAGDEGVDRLRKDVGLPLSTYFSGPKIKWILDNVDGVRKRAEAGELAFGNMDTWVLWNLTGGKNGGVHATDVTNASPDDADEPGDARMAPAEPRPDGDPGVDAAGDQVLLGDLRRGQGHRARRRPGGGHPRRPAGGDVRADLLRPG